MRMWMTVLWMLALALAAPCGCRDARKPDKPEDKTTDAERKTREMLPTPAEPKGDAPAVPDPQQGPADQSERPADSQVEAPPQPPEDPGVGKTQTRTTRLILDSLYTALELYQLHIGHYPTEAEGGLTALLEKPQYDEETATDRWRGPYLRRAPADAWGRPLRYELIETDSGSTVPRVWSVGPDGEDGTADDIVPTPAPPDDGGAPA